MRGGISQTLSPNADNVFDMLSPAPLGSGAWNLRHRINIAMERWANPMITKDSIVRQVVVVHTKYQDLCSEK
jgi:hypothetical protein